MLTTNADLYATDFAAWCRTTAELIRTEQWEAIDPEALAEELESLGKSQKRELESRLEGLVLHLLKWECQPSRHLESQSWYHTIRAHRSELARLLRDNPSLKPQVAPVLQEVYPEAREAAWGEMTSAASAEVARDILRRGHLSLEPPLPELGIIAVPPAQCPWGVDQILDKDFWPGAA